MITVVLQGGLANQMFQYAFGRSLAFRRQEELRVVPNFNQSDSSYSLRHCELNQYDIDIELLKIHPRPTDIREYLEQGLTFNKEALITPANFFSGYWQCERYFHPDTIRKEFAKPKGEPNAACQAVADKLNSCESAFIGVRRGYQKYKSEFDFHGVLPLEYSLHGMNMIKNLRPDAKFFVFSDDVEWCRANFNGYPVEVVDVNGPDEKAWDIWLMQQCKHACIANSSFHWWPAWLGADYNNGIVVAPDRWFVNEKTDIVPERWIKL